MGTQIFCSCITSNQKKVEKTNINIEKIINQTENKNKDLKTINRDKNQLLKLKNVLSPIIITSFNKNNSTFDIYEKKIDIFNNENIEILNSSYNENSGFPFVKIHKKMENKIFK